VTDVLFTTHRYVGYAVALVVLIAAFTAFGRAKDAREFTPGPYVLAVVLLDIQVLLGLLLYGAGGYWGDEFGPEQAYVHPILALLGLAAGHAFLRRARGHQMAVDAHRTAGRGLVTAFVLILLAIIVVTVPPFL
jgi:heme A synthase